MHSHILLKFNAILYSHGGRLFQVEQHIQVAVTVALASLKVHIRYHSGGEKVISVICLS